MKFTLSHKRDLMGNKITVKVVASSKETIKKVRTRLDAGTLAYDILAPAEIQYERIFPRAGNAGPGRKHKLIVSGTNNQGKTSVASRRWQDTS